MVDVIVGPLVDKLTGILVGTVQAEASLLLGVRDEITSLRNQLEWIRGFLMDAEQKSKENEVVNIWVSHVRDMAYDAEDVVDAFSLHLEQQTKGTIVKKITSFWRKLKTLHRIGKLIENINKRGAEISNHKVQYSNEFTVQPKESGCTFERLASRRTSLIIEESLVVGFHKEVAEAADWLTKHEEWPQRRIMSIIGTGGLGKTTLAKMIYGRKDVEGHFNVRAWICASQEYQVRNLLLSALKQVKGAISDDELSRLERKDEGELKMELYKFLQGNRYFVVIDDVWKEGTWKRICGGFPDNEHCSRILITTQKMDVAKLADPWGQHHELRMLNETESWELLCKKVFATGKCPSHLVAVGKEIVKKCSGLPLAIVVLSGLLIRKRNTRDAWSKVLASGNWKLAQDSNPCREILALSYNDLPYYLKPCFLYFALFPKDFEFDVRKLILLWTAEGFLQKRGELKVEDVAEEYFEELTERSLIQVTRRRYEGGPADTCQIQDPLRELAIAEAKSHRFSNYHGNNSVAESSGSRRLAIHSSIHPEDAKNYSRSNLKLRSLLCFDRGFDASMWFGEGMKMLRVLDLQCVDMLLDIPHDIGKLAFLHYLGLMNICSKTFPSSICNLVKLQTLDVRGSVIKANTPTAIWKMKQLRHLLLETWTGLEQFTSIDKDNLPRNLLTLDISSDIWTMKGLSKNFVEFDCLRSLTLHGELMIGNLKNCFPSSLTLLILEGCMLEKDPSSVLESLPYLEELQIRKDSYAGRRMFFSAHGFENLQYLHFYELSLEEWVVEEGAMASLKHLKISSCQSLNMLPDGLKYATDLQKLELSLMPEKFCDRIKENGKDWKKINNVPIIICT